MFQVAIFGALVGWVGDDAITLRPIAPHERAGTSADGTAPRVVDAGVGTTGSSQFTDGSSGASVAPRPSPLSAASSETLPSPSPSGASLPITAAAPSARPTTPLGCPTTWFCYPRLGIAGPIVPYTDCFGGSDIGSDIRAFTCLSPSYLMGHAYTQMGRITEWRPGDAVYAYGQRFEVTEAVTSRSCDPPHLPLAPLSMQTSLSPDRCGAVLVVQAR